MNSENPTTAARWFPHVTVASIARQGNQYLLVEETHNGKTVINQPAGHVEKGESLEQAVIRETLEETGWHFKPRFSSGIYHFVAANGETYFRFVFVGDLIREEPDYVLDPAIDGIKWMTLDQISNAEPNLRNKVVLQCIKDFEAGNRIPDSVVQQLK